MAECLSKKIKQEETKLKKKNDTVSDIIYIIDKIREDNIMKYSCLKPYISSLIINIERGQLKLTKLEKQLTREEYLQLMSYIFYGCICITKETSTVAPTVENVDEKMHKRNFVKMNKWLTNLESFGNLSKQGDVYKGYFLGKEVVLKKPKKKFFLENTLKDYFNGIKCINSLRMECPMFAYTLGILTIETPSERKKLDEIWLVTEFIKGKTLKEMLKCNELSFKEFLDIFAQILVALEIGQNKYKFCHYDLHTDNVIIVPITNNYTCHVHVYDINVKTKFMPVMIDYGMSSSSLEKDISIGQHKIEDNGIFPYLFPGYDPYVFLLFCRDVSSVSIKSGINHLFKFYGDIDHIDYVSTLKNNTGRQTPLLFLEYIIKTYPQLSMDFTPRTIMTKSLLFKTPSMMMADLFLNPNEKESISSCFNNELNNGFIYFMLECTRNKLWFGKDKNMLTMSSYKKMISHDLNFLQKFISFVHAFPGTSSNRGETTEEKNNWSERIDDLQCAVNLLFLMKQLKIYDFKPYREWIDKFEASEMYSWYKSNKPYIDRCQRLK